MDKRMRMWFRIIPIGKPPQRACPVDWVINVIFLGKVILTLRSVFYLDCLDFLKASYSYSLYNS